MNVIDKFEETKVVIRSRKSNKDIGLTLKLQLLFYSNLFYCLILPIGVKDFVNKYIIIYTCNSNHQNDRHQFMTPFLCTLLVYKEVLTNE